MCCRKSVDLVPAEVRVWLAARHTELHGNLNGVALLVQEKLKRDPYGGQLSVFSAIAKT